MLYIPPIDDGTTDEFVLFDGPGAYIVSHLMTLTPGVTTKVWVRDTLEPGLMTWHIRSRAEVETVAHEGIIS